MNLGGGDLVNLTAGSAADDRYPAVFPDGRRLVFSSERSSPNFDLFLMNVDGTNVVPLTVSAGFDDRDPAVSPSGKLIAFSRDDGGGYEIALMPVGGAAQVANPDPSSDYGPAFSGDGKRIFFGSNRPGAGGGEDIWSMKLDGSKRRTRHHGKRPRRCRGIGRVDLSLRRSPGDDRVLGCPDKLTGTRRADVIVGNGGNDVLRGRGGRDRLCGNKGRDRLLGGPALDRLRGGPGRDRLLP
jgi:dipeptidyl aminopeptidase/acylaminoacyl peptidase